MYKLFYSPGACSMAVHVALNEMNLPVDLVKVNLSQEKSKRGDEFLKANPRGQVPALVADGTNITEGAAILLWLSEKTGKLMPSISQNNGKDRAEALQWLMFCNASLHPAYGKAFGSMHMTDQALKDATFKAAISQIDDLWKVAEEKLGKSKYLAGDQVTLADILITVIANWGQTFPQKANIGSNVKRLIAEISQRPAYQKALAAEEVEYKAAA